MSLRLVYGRGGCGKSTWCMRAIKEEALKGSGRPLVLVVPEQFSFQAGRNLLEEAGEEITSKVDVLSFRRMAYEVFMETGGLGRKYINPAGKAMLIYSVMDESRDSFKTFTRSAKQKGFTEDVGKLITEFKRYSVSPETLKEASELSNDDENLKNKLSDLYIIYSGFEKHIREKYIDADDDLTVLSEKLEDCGIFDGAQFWVDEFSSFTPQEYLVLEKLIQKGDVNITLPVYGPSNFYDYEYDYTDVFAPIRNTEFKLMKLCSRLNVKLKNPVILDSRVCKRFKDSRELNHMEKNFFSYPFKKYIGECSDIGIYKAANRFEEVQHIARSITAVCREKGCRYRDIAVVARSMDMYEGTIEAVFGEYGIPYFIDSKRSIENSPVIVLVLSALDIVLKGWTYESVFKFLKTGLSGIDTDDVDTIENYVLAAGIKGRRWIEDKLWDFRVNFDYNSPEMSEEDKKYLDNVNDIRYKIVSPLLNFQSEIKKADTAAGYARAIYNFLVDINVPERIEDKIAALNDNGDFDTAGEYEKIWDMLMEVLDQSVEVLKDGSITFEKYVNVISMGLKEEEIGIIPPSLDQVIVGSVDRIRNHGIKVLYVIGVNDGIFPQMITGEGILSDSDRQKLKDSGIELAEGSDTRVFEEQYLIYKTITMPSQKLYMSYAAADHEGKALRPSVIIARTRKLFTAVKEESGILNDIDDKHILDKISTPGATFKELVSALRVYVEKSDINPAWLDVYRWYMKDDEYRGKCSTAVDNLSYTNMVKNISTESVRKVYGSKIRTSVSRLERYSRCPFAYFIEYGLRAKERKIYAFNPPDVGSLVHIVLDKFSQKIDDENLSWRSIDNDWCMKTIDGIIKEVLDENPSILKSTPRYVYISDKLKKLIVKAVNIMIYQLRKGEFNPAGHEIVFSNSGKYPPINIKLDSGETVELSGRIDRLDEAKEGDGVYLRIIDYKTGNKDFRLSDLYNGVEMQLLVYMDAVLNYMQKSGKRAVPGGILYFRVDDPIIKSDGRLDDDEIKNEIISRMKMKGLVLSDIKVIKSMDSDFDKTSLIIPVSVKKDGTLSEKSSAVSIDDFNLLKKHVNKKIAGFCEDMLKGVIDIKPCIESKKSACEFCSFLSVCGFDTSIQDNRYKILRNYSNKDVLEKIKNEDGEVK